MSFRFEEPTALLLLLAIPITYYFYLLSLKKRKKAIIKFSSIGLIKEANKKNFNWRKHASFIILILILTSLITAIADPHIPLKKIKKGVNVVLVIDTSGSMQAKDFKPSRIEAAKIAAKTLIENLKPKDNVGIVVFNNGATTASYLTPLKEKALDKLASIKAQNGATAIGDGLALAVDMITSIPNKKKVIILLSDGVNNAGMINPEEAIKYAKENNIQVYTVGMGSEGKTIIGYDWFGNPQYAELDEGMLKKIASETGGEYYRAVDEDTLNQIYKGLSNKIKREKEDTSIKDWFIITAILLLGIEMYLRYGKLRIIN